MILYCWKHNAAHEFTAGEVEKIFYAMTGLLFDACRQDADEDYAEYHPKLIICPKEALDLARDSEAYLEYVEQGLECRYRARRT
jgi:hypothetical protein